ncbi:chorismate mutase [Paenibacillus tarimensis]|uniref:chorismate mutase n=1 Tax=Paenibacillus tarimensis TaxID=416012 RepID=UPI001F1E42FE|nr:chorismate mutase [Paenibacillus tarimensis]MCF2943331.1 chorismate mutase [Paenibacillus tarimensis]
MNQEMLAGHRAEIDSLDRQIVALIAQRTQVVKKIMVLKTDEESVRSCDRVQQVLDKVSRMAEENGLEPAIAVPVYETLIKVLTDMQLEYLHNRNLESKV